jgi:hypothetical protein
MAKNSAFYPMGKTFLLNANATNNVANVYADSPSSQYLFVNHEIASTGQPVYVRISATSGANAAVASNTTPQYGIPIRPAESLVLSGPQCGNGTNVYITFITSTGLSNVYVTPGEGML